LWKRRKPARTDLLFTGLCDSGKTYLFTQFLFAQQKETFTSIIENVGQYVTQRGAAIRVVDIPGHERARHKFFDQYKLLAKGLVFMVDSVTIQKDIRDAAE
jgi:signal recognition particle receptor subunit beta